MRKCEDSRYNDSVVFAFLNEEIWWDSGGNEEIRQVQECYIGSVLSRVHYVEVALIYAIALGFESRLNRWAATKYRIG